MKTYTRTGTWYISKIYYSMNMIVSPNKWADNLKMGKV